ncbi:MAG: DUF6134 family protein [Betaproteobacteria bacterium]
MRTPRVPGLHFLVGTMLLLASAQSVAQPRVWDFQVFLDDASIGYHRFTLGDEPSGRDMKIEARFEVKVLFVTVYRYVHEASELWRGSCLTRLEARTNDDGTRLVTEAALDGKRLTVSTASGSATLAGCVMSFAYWNSEILRQSQLLNVQTGEYQAVKIAVIGDENIAVRGAQVAATRYRITGPKNPIDLWYSNESDWLALESTVAGGKRLRYQIK